MSVVVIGMDMPNRCFECPVIDTEDGFWCSATNKSLRKEHGINLTRPKWCPLRPLPEKHGRLIDADEMEAKGYALSKLHIDYEFGEVWREVIPFYEVPTIIEAEGENDG